MREHHLSRIRDYAAEHNLSGEDIALIFNAGLAYSLSERWGLSLSVSYILLKTTSTIDLYANDGTRLARSETDLDLNPIVSSLLLSYRF